MTTNLLDLWSRPQFNSERVSQLLFGETVEVGAVRKGYIRVVQADGYAGWAAQAHLKAISRKQMTEFSRRINAVISGEKAVLHRSIQSAEGDPHFLYYGTRLRTSGRIRGCARCYLPDESFVLLKPQRIRPIKSRKGREATPARLVAEAKRFLGVPYLWGGVSPAGFDCSGFARAIYGIFGLYLPRDTKDQIRCGAKVSREDVRTGDLLFFERHVGLALAGQRIIHASVGGSGVRINSLNPAAKNYRPDLDRSFATARRILC
ncbi:MAG: C40 family peptidase [bacterium]|nr:C40 family peptidase [bacterium]